MVEGAIAAAVLARDSDIQARELDLTSGRVGSHRLIPIQSSFVRVKSKVASAPETRRSGVEPVAAQCG
jgi:hypothetical protein